MINILIVDDKHDIRGLIADILEDEGYSTQQAYNVETTLSSIREIVPNAIILDIWLEGSHMDGIGLLKTIRKNYANLPIIMISGHATPETAALAMKLGAYDFIEKPFKSEKLVLIIKRALEASSLSDTNLSLQRDILDLQIIGNSRYALSIREEISHIAPTNSRVMLSGESGTGKSTLARIIHMLSSRSKRKFIHFKSYNQSASELEHKLLGENYEGQSAIEQADGGTLFLDEVTNLSLATQHKLLEIVQSGHLNKGNKKRIIDVRFITGTCHPTHESLKKNLLNESLLSRLNVSTLCILPLRERKSDIIPLSTYFIEKLSTDFMPHKCVIDEQTYSLMLSHNWPGNIRQLSALIELLLIRAVETTSFVITPDMLPQYILESTNQAHKNLEFIPRFLNKKYRQAKQIFEKEYFSAQLEKFDGNIAKTAQFIGMDRTALHRKIKSLKISAQCIGLVSEQVEE